MQDYASAEGGLDSHQGFAGLRYTPKKPRDAQPIDIVPPDQRKAAMLALLDDRMTSWSRRLRRAIKGRIARSHDVSGSGDQRDVLRWNSRHRRRPRGH